MVLFFLCIKRPPKGTPWEALVNVKVFWEQVEEREGSDGRKTTLIMTPLRQNIPTESSLIFLCFCWKSQFCMFLVCCGAGLWSFTLSKAPYGGAAPLNAPAHQHSPAMYAPYSQATHNPYSQGYGNQSNGYVPGGRVLCF